MARRKKKKDLKTISLNKYSLGGPMIAIGFLYFFSLFFAANAPVLHFLTSLFSIVFGKFGLIFFFFFSIVFGGLIIWKEYLIKTFIKQYVILLVLISGVINFPLIEGGANVASVRNFDHYGGYISRPVLWFFQRLFGEQGIATKMLLITSILIVLIWIIISLKIYLPRINLNLPVKDDSSDLQKKSNKKSIIEEIDDEDEDCDTKVEEKTSSKSTDNHGIMGGLKTLIKGKIEQKLAEKEKKVTIKFPTDKPSFPLEILSSPSHEGVTIDEEYLVAKAQSLTNKLAEFGISVTVQGFNVGPSVIQIKIHPDAGIKISQIEALKNDLALSLKTKTLRIISPIPGTDSVGIEIPNPKPVMVYLSEILGSNEFVQGMNKSLMNLALGKGIDGKLVIKALDEMPHLLIAGSTGSGKSVCVNNFILSLMYQNTPSELRFLMIDPKQVELGMYDGTPYLLAPIITHPEKAVKLLKRAVEEMTSRYSLLKQHRVKKISEYNDKNPDDKMYRIVVVIDELADLMMSGHKKDTEHAITRLAQMARAVGIHLILATQRPSVNVITGLIKTNIPTRIAFSMVSQIDSRTVIDMRGAEDLVGKGDLLYIDPTTKYPSRIQNPFVSTPETEEIVEALKDKYMKGINEEQIYNPELVKLLEGKKDIAGDSDAGEEDEEILQKAIDTIIQTKKASATLLQRKLGVGFARAARIMDILEERGIVGPQDGAKPREIFM